MIGMSEMYRVSGGCCYLKCCEECANYIGDKGLSCILYTNAIGATWGGKRIACNYFREKCDNGQMDMAKWFGIMGKNA